MLLRGGAWSSGRLAPTPWKRFSDDANVLGFLTLATGSYIELDALALAEGLEAIALDVGVVDKHVIALVAGDEAEPLLRVEELDGTDC